MDFAPSNEMKMFGDMVCDWVDREAPEAYARELERRETKYPFELWDKMTAAGFHAVGVDERYGGQGGDVFMQVALARGLARSLGGLRTTADKVDGGWLVNGNKTWCSSAHVADYILLLARTEHDVAKRHEGVSLFLLPAAAEGVQLAQLTKLGMRSIGSCDVGMDDVFVPDELLLGEPGTAWYMLLPTLNNERTLVSAFCLGILDGILEDALEFVGERHAFGKPVGQFQILQHCIADIALKRQEVELMVHHAAWVQTHNPKAAHMATTMTKVAASEAACWAADTGIQIRGGMGYSAETDMQRYWRDARLWKIGPITQEMARNSIAEQLGLPRSF